MPPSKQSRWWLAAEGVVASALVILPWCLGGSPTWTTSVLFVLGVTSFGLWWLGAARGHRRFSAHPVLALPFLVLVFATMQVVPLPPSLLSLLSEPMSELREFALAPLGLTESRALSTDPASTARAMGRLVGLLGLFTTSLQLSKHSEVRRRLATVLAISGVSVAICGFGHLLAGEEELFGLHRFALVMLVTPFGNTNHLAAFLGLAGTVSLALAIDAKTRDSLIGWLGSAGICGVGVFLSYSRGGIATFLMTWALVGAALLARRGGGLRSVLPWVAIGGTMVFAGLLSLEQLIERADSVSSLERLRATKVELWPMLAHGALHYWPAGMGLGAFELGFARYQTTQLDVTFTHPENIALQWAAELGVPLSLALGLAGSVLAWRLWRAARETSFERYLFIALFGVLAHDVFDFSLELNAVSACAAVLAGIVVSTDPLVTPIRLRRGGLLLVGSIGLVGVLALVAGDRTHHDAERELADKIRDGRSFGEVRAVALASIDRHPVDWVLYANMANDLAQRGDPRESLAWTNRVLFLRATDARIHTSAARALLRLGNQLQALGELRAAWLLNDSSMLEVGLNIASRGRVWERVLVERVGFLTQEWLLLRGLHRDSEARALIQAGLDFGPSEEVRREALMLEVRHESELGDPQHALAMLESLDSSLRALPELQLVRIRLLFKLKQFDLALAELEKLFAHAPNDVAVGLELVGVLSEMKRPLAALDVLERMRPFTDGPTQRSAMLQREAALWSAQERWSRALDALQTASRIEPSRADLHYRAAEVLERMGSLHSALDEVRRGRALDTPNGAQAVSAWLNRLEAAQSPQ